MITIVDYGAGNLGSIQNMLKKISEESVVSSSPEDIKNASKLILPGVGSFDYGMNQLHSRGLVDTLNQKVLEEKTPILGICLGVQLFTKKSEEGNTAGLGWFEAETVKFNFPAESNLKIPNMGWQNTIIKKQSKLIHNLTSDARFYFVHSFHLKANENDTILTANYGYDFACGLEKNNIVGVQFHPEKSHKFGMQLLKNFATFY